MAVDLMNGIINLEGDVVMAEVKRRMEAGEDAVAILADCQQGMHIIGKQFDQGDVHLAELILSGEILKSVLKHLEPYLVKVSFNPVLKRVVIATLQGDIHDLGKNLFVMLLESRGFEVYDLGVDVDPDIVVESVRCIKPHFVCFSGLVTPVLGVMKSTVGTLIQKGLRNDVKILIGGGITVPQNKDYVGADFQTIDAMDGLNYCLKESWKAEHYDNKSG